MLFRRCSTWTYYSRKGSAKISAHLPFPPLYRIEGFGQVADGLPVRIMRIVADKLGIARVDFGIDFSPQGASHLGRDFEFSIEFHYFASGLCQKERGFLYNDDTV